MLSEFFRLENEGSEGERVQPRTYLSMFVPPKIVRFWDKPCGAHCSMHSSDEAKKEESSGEDFRFVNLADRMTQLRTLVEPRSSRLSLEVLHL